MDKFATINLGGKDYTLALTFNAAKEIDALCGGIDNYLDAFQGEKSLVEQADYAYDLLLALLKGGREYAREALDREEPEMSRAKLEATLLPFADVGSTIKAIVNAMNAGLGRTIEIEDDKKNVEATQSD